MLAFGLIASASNMTARFATVPELVGSSTGTVMLPKAVLPMAPSRRSAWPSGVGGNAKEQ